MTPATVERKGNRGEMEHRIRIGSIKGMLAWGSLTRQAATLKAPVDRGRLARSIDLGDVFEADHLVFHIDLGTNVEYARAQEFGSGIHEEKGGGSYIPIRARRKKSLAFKWAAGPTNHPAYDAESGLFFFKQIMHPGVRPHPYLRPALQENGEAGRRLVLSAVTAELRT